jgi:hypothetical protein
VSLHRLNRRCPLILGRRHGFPKRSFKTTLTSIASASNRLRRELSCSKAYNRRASETSKPPYLAFHL